MDAKLYSLTVASNMTLSVQELSNEWRHLKQPCTGDLNFMDYQETPVKLQIPPLSWKPLLSETFEEFLHNN